MRLLKKNILLAVPIVLRLINNFLKKIFSLMVQIGKSFYIFGVLLKKNFFAKNINSPILVLLSLLYLGSLSFVFMWMFPYNLIDMFQIIILSLFSFAVSIFISDNFKFSNNKFIFYLQNFVFYSFIYLILVIILVLTT